MKKYIIVFCVLSLLCLSVLTVIAVENNKKIEQSKVKTYIEYVTEDNNINSCNLKTYLELANEVS